jgi:DNA polymerase III alpha subunit
MRLALAPREESGAWREYDRETRVRHELETLEIAITAHPVEVIRERLARTGALPVAPPAAQLVREGAGSVLGILAAARRVRTKRGESMLFLTLEDESGLAECTLFPPVYARFGAIVRGGWLLHATGTVEAPFGAPTLTVDRLASVAPCA